MANDLVTILKLDSKEFDNNLARSSKQLRDFNSNVKKQGGDFNVMKTQIKDLSGGFNLMGMSLSKIGWGAAVAAGASFIKMGFEAGQQSDNFRNSMDAAKTTLQSFAGALVTMDWDTFNGGILQAFRNSKALKEALDDLGDVLGSKRVFDARVQNDFNELLNDARDTTKSLTERQNAYNLAKARQLELEKKTANAISAQEQTLLAIWKEQTGSDTNPQMLRNMFENSDLLDRFNAGKGIEETTKQFKLLYEEMYKGAKWWDDFTDTEKIKLVQSDLGKYAKAIQKFNDKEREDIRQKIIANEQYRQSIIANEKTVQRVNASLSKQDDKEIKTTTPKTATNITPNKELYQSYNSLTAKADEFKNKLSEAQRTSDIAAIDFYMNEITKLNVQIKNLERIIELQSPKQLTAQPLHLQTPKIDYTAIGLEMKIQAEKNLELARANNQLSASYENLSSQLSMLSGAVGSISDNPAIKALAGSLMILSAVKSLQSATTWIEYVIGAASVAAAAVSMANSFANAKDKFAGGGIVGDQNLVRVNSGEMILNQAQQTRLFNQISRDEQTDNQISNVQFTIRGQELIGVLNNYNAKFR